MYTCIYTDILIYMMMEKRLHSSVIVDKNILTNFENIGKKFGVTSG